MRLQAQHKIALLLVAAASLLVSVAHAEPTPPAVIVSPAKPTPRENLASREVMRYLYVRTGRLLSIHPTDRIPSTGDVIVLATGNESPALGRFIDKSTTAEIASLKHEPYLLKTVTKAPRSKILLIVGGDDVGLLYGAYRFAEKLGVRFYINGDTIPDQRVPFVLPEMDEIGRPLFDIRGIQPFHDFAEGPDWWNRDDYLCYVSQLAKMRMNFIGLHTYPEGEPNAEPAVWIGEQSDIAPFGKVTFSYPSSWMNTARTAWGYDAEPTSSYDCGASQLFANDAFGPDVMAGMMPQPQSADQSNDLFNRTAVLLRDVFSEARSLGVKTCVGTETPLRVPAVLQDHMKQAGTDSATMASRTALYRGIFTHIANACPVDYYWLWTPETWTANGNTADQFKAATDDIQCAVAAARSVGAPFQLATCGWVLGPQSDRSALDRFLPKTMPVSSINRDLGNDPIDDAYGKISGRQKWAIPWLENDPQLTAPEPWVGRMLYDAADAHRMGCTGLIGIHWRTKAIAPNVTALADAAWDQSYVPRAFGTPHDGPQGGEVSSFTDPIAGTQNQAVYQTVRYDLNGCTVAVPNGVYTVTLNFVEPFYSDAGKRVFGVKLQGNQVIEHLDIFARAGKDRALDLAYPDVAVTNGVLHVDFTTEVEFPCIAGIEISGQVAGKPYVRRLKCGGPAVDGYEAEPQSEEGVNRDHYRSMSTLSFYTDYACASFGQAVAAQAGKIMSDVDGMNMPKPVDWVGGPGGIAANRSPWQLVQPQYSFVEAFAALRPKVLGAGNLDRFDYWLSTYRYDEALAQAGCLRGQLDAEMEQISRTQDVALTQQLAAKAVALRIALARAWEKAMWDVEATVSTPGELGTIANLQQHTRMHNHFLDQYDTDLAKITGAPLPVTAAPSGSYAGPDRLIVPTVRTRVAAGERLTLTVILLGHGPAGASASGSLYWRPLGSDAFARVPLAHVARSVYRATIPACSKNVTAFEYYVKAGNLVFPATAPKLDQTVVVN
jgi:hypothetical protein